MEPVEPQYLRLDTSSETTAPRQCYGNLASRHAQSVARSQATDFRRLACETASSMGSPLLVIAPRFCRLATVSLLALITYGDKAMPFATAAGNHSQSWLVCTSLVPRTTYRETSGCTFNFARASCKNAPRHPIFPSLHEIETES
jgi:hypothetical protein